MVTDYVEQHSHIRWWEGDWHQERFVQELLATGTLESILNEEALWKP